LSNPLVSCPIAPCSLSKRCSISSSNPYR
jgi:hypothetical protein